MGSSPETYTDPSLFTDVFAPVSIRRPQERLLGRLRNEKTVCCNVVLQCY